MGADAASSESPFRDGPDLGSWLRLLRTTRELSAASERAVRAVGLSGSEFELLAAVSLAEGSSQRELAAVLAVTKGSIAQVAARLEDERLVRREPDGRLNRVYLTPRGRQLVEAAAPAHRAAIAATLADRPDADTAARATAERLEEMVPS